VLSERVLGGLFEVAVSSGEWVDVLLVVAESYWPRSCSPTVESVGSGELLSPVPESGGTGDSPTRGEPAPPAPPPPPPARSPPPGGRSGFCRLVVEKFMLPASPVSRGCRILLSRTCWRRSASRLGLPRLRMRDLRCFSWEGGEEEEDWMSFLDEEGAGLRWEPMPSRRKILRFRPPSGRSGIRLVSGGGHESDRTWIRGGVKRGGEGDKGARGGTLASPGRVSPRHGTRSAHSTERRWRDKRRRAQSRMADTEGQGGVVNVKRECCRWTIRCR
jgi:hypothetical protein